ncbi:TPA: hypothetical protein DDW35_09830, partial [Candidatus Sumerlaeota bacterium]|nr:hypothetical protein [Candidatus Sumerlaeota bacterium]
MRTNRVQIVSNCQDDSFQHLRDLLQKNGYEVDEVCSKAETPGETTSIFFQQTQDDSLKERQGQVLALAHFPEANPNPVLCFDAQGIMLYANPAGKSLLQQWGGEIPDDFKQFCLTALTDVEKKTIEVHVAQDIYCFDIVPLAESGCIHVYGRDITHRKRAEFERETAIEFLRLVNESTSTPDLIHRAVEFFQKCSGCDAVGIRLREGEDYPYYETHGFPADFVRLETHLCARDIAGQLMRDEIGHPIIECMCGNVICERTDPSKPFFTTNGSFWSNCTTELLASTTDADRQTHTRNRCNGQGYESVALLPLRFGKEHLGLLQLNNHQRDTFSAPSIALWERLADYLAVALSQSYARDALHASEDTYRSLFDNMLNGFAYCQMLFDEQDNPCDFIYISVNSAFETLTGLKNVIGKRVSEVIPRLKTDDRELFNLYGKVAREGQPERIEVFVEAMQMWFSISVYCPLRGYFVAVFDVITERKKAEEALRQANARLQRFVDANIVGIIVANAEGAIIEANDYYLNL